MGGRKCSICEHPKRQEIDLALVQPDASLRAISSQFKVGRSALQRHVNSGHIVAKMAKAARAHEAVEADDLLHEADEYQAAVKDVLVAAKKSKNHSLVLKAAREGLHILEVKGRILGAFTEDKKRPEETREWTPEEVKCVIDHVAGLPHR